MPQTEDLQQNSPPLEPTEEQRRKAEASLRAKYGEQNEKDVDTSLLREYIGLTLTQRIAKKNQATQLFVDELHRVGKPLKAGSIFVALKKAQVHFVVVGDVGLTLYGRKISVGRRDQVPKTAHVLYARNEINQAKLIDALVPYQPYLRIPGLPFVLDAQTLNNVPNAGLTTDLGEIDLLGEIPGGTTYEDVLSRAEDFEFFGVPVPVASEQDLLSIRLAFKRQLEKNHALEAEMLKKMEQSEGL